MGKYIMLLFSIWFILAALISLQMGLGFSNQSGSEYLWFFSGSLISLLIGIFFFRKFQKWNRA
ncbi:MAG: hypothetical protein BGO59_17585 [Spirosoma sp. 48-14]|nr:MAG: hypothetical protein BGO59_17585 [Spirosoma sp. 48-14]